MTTQQAVRRWIMTGAVTAITVTGTLYGAGLKGSQELKQKQQEIRQATPEDKIAQLEVVRSQLVSRKEELERKLEKFADRRRERESAKEAK
ncbi:hypothetical protein BU24DRAFT_460293 [Aaosphaeria arxii CBS 175.79]|uniref:Cytochrome c oxidase assembly protein n=1 Tax=Aaosphaeria arxii CBS 175.79 TaxID=1450172 RepID=A0A6A5XW66_9PLEO|nr:uncharacterized protein BU24DRAFT_460293 [Aaosphaeria arxii CBS 175.79]KAF2017219.1 hypothetical protein BU24DRAFT_460293 [Aaosphaeria arxii CBS 175.79]